MKTNTIICGEAAATLATFEAESVDLVVTDPPYLVSYRDRDGRTIRNDNRPEGVLPVFAELYRVLKPGSYCAVFCGWSAISQFANAWGDAGFRTVSHIVWRKRYASRAGHTLYMHESAYVLAKGYPRLPAEPISDVQEWEYSGNRSHPTEKAVSVIAPLVRSFSQPGDLVLDPFSGSGSTSVAAALNERRYVGIELEPKYCDVARARLAGIERRHWRSAKRRAPHGPSR